MILKKKKEKKRKKKKEEALRIFIKLKLNEQPHAIAPHTTTTTTTNLHEPTFCRTKPYQAKSVHHVILRQQPLPTYITILTMPYLKPHLFLFFDVEFVAD